jgi:hypothetical protein
MTTTTTRAKFKVLHIATSPDGSKSVSMAPVTSGSSENEQFYRYTPAGSIQLSLMSPAAANAFTEGAEVYVDFTPAVDASTLDLGSSDPLESTDALPDDDSACEACQ